MRAAFLHRKIPCVRPHRRCLGIAQCLECGVVELIEMALEVSKAFNIKIILQLLQAGLPPIHDDILSNDSDTVTRQANDSLDVSLAWIAWIVEYDNVTPLQHSRHRQTA